MFSPVTATNSHVPYFVKIVLRRRVRRGGGGGVRGCKQPPLAPVFILLYPRIHVVYKGYFYIGISVSSGGWAVGRAGGRVPILRLELLPQFLTNSHEI